MAIDKLIPQYLNTDDDERILKVYEMVDALNIRVSHEDDGDAGVVKNVEGNTSISPKNASDAIPASGINKVIGAVGSEAYKCIYFFLYNGNDGHGIYKYTAQADADSNDTYQKVYESRSLNFNMQSYVSADLIVNQQGEHLLYFTDDRNEPRKINATKALSGSYPSEFTGGSDDEKELFLTVCKQPPLEPPTFVFNSNASIKRNQLHNKLFQFAYQYVYDDGEVSALSPYSKIAVSPNHLAFNSSQRNLYETNNNEINIYVDCNKGPVDKIRLFAREGQNGYFVRIDEIPNNREVDQEIVTFRNDGIYNQLDENSANKLFDAVPRQAAAQTFSNNRLFYGNYLEGFDNVDTESIQYPVYKNIFLQPEVRSNIGGTYNTGFFYDVAALQLTDFYTRTASGIGSSFEDLRYLELGETIEPLTSKYIPTGDFTNVQQTFSSNAPIGFQIDTSQIPENGFEVASTILLSYSMDGDSIGFSNNTLHSVDADTHDYELTSFDVDITLREGDTVVSGNGMPAQISVLNPAKFARKNNLGNYKAIHNFDRQGCLNNLKITGGMDISAEVEVPAGTNKQGIVDLIVQAINLHAPLSVGVHSGVKSGDDIANDLLSYSAGDLSNHLLAFKADDSALKSADISSNYFLGVGEDTDRPDILFVEWDGVFTMTPSANYVANQDHVFVSLKTSSVDLAAVGAATFAVNQNILNIITPTTSKFAPTSHHTDGIVTGYVFSASEIDCEIHTADLTSNGDGLPFKDIVGSDATFLTTIRNVNVSGNGAIVFNDSSVSANKSFKSGATHEFGIVYFDNRNRNGGVQKLGSVEVAPLGSSKRNGRNGTCEIDIRLLHEPPEWAERWAPVYSTNTTYDTFLQFTVAEALLPNLTLFRDILSPVDTDDENDSLRNSRLINSSIGGDIRSAIFLSMRTLEGKNNSYKEFKGGEIDYQYQEGDILRIVSYVNPQGETIYPDGKEFKITGYNYFIDNDENPLQVSTTSVATVGDDEGQEKDDVYRRTGWFLSIKDNNTTNFNRSSVENATDFFSQKCVIEIMRPKKKIENPVFYEMGLSYPIVEVSSRRTHGGDRSNSTITGLECKVLNANYFESDTRFYVGDKVVFDHSVAQADINQNNFVFVAGVAPTGTSYRYFVDSSNPFAPASFNLTYDSCYITSSYLTANGTFPGVVTINEGDVYMRQREMLVNAKTPFAPIAAGINDRVYSPDQPRKQDYTTFIVEDDRASDFFESDAKSFGRAHIETPDQERIKRISSITYSDPFAFDSSQLNLSSFNPNLFPYYDMPSKHGEVTSLIDGNESITVLQESKVSILPIGRNVVEMNGESNMVASTNVIGTPTFMAGSYGPGNSPEGVVERFGQVYFSDVRSGVVCRIDGKGITPISSEKMESYFEGLFGDVNNAVARPRVPSGFDPENGEYVVTTEAISLNKIVIDGDTIGYGHSPIAGTVNPDLQVSPKFEDSLILTWGTDPLDWDESAWESDACTPEWDDLHSGTIYLDRLTETNGVYVDPLYIGETQNLRVDTIVEGQLYRGSALLSLKDYTVDFCTTLMDIVNGGTDTLTITSITDPEQATVAWGPSVQKWLTFYSFYPEMYANVQNRFFSFKNGQMYYHNKNATRNNFYGTQYTSKIDLISKANPSSIKLYKAMSLEGNANWETTLSNETQQTAVIQKTHWNEKEGLRYANIPRVIDEDPGASTVISSSAYSVVGEVASVDSGSITFVNDINKSPVMTGPSSLMYVCRDGESVWTVIAALKLTGVSSKNKAITNIDPSTLSIGAGDILANACITGVSGDTLRGYYTKLSMENDDTTAKELFAVNVVYEPSLLHNDGGQPNNQ